MKAMSVLALAAIGLAGGVQAQTAGSSTAIGQAPAPQMTSQPQQAAVPMRADGTFTDECGFRYNSRGDRIDARGRVLPPPLTGPGAGSCR
jgi:hypothetical protein